MTRLLSPHNPRDARAGLGGSGGGCFSLPSMVLVPASTAGGVALAFDVGVGFDFCGPYEHQERMC